MLWMNLRVHVEVVKWKQPQMLNVVKLVESKVNGVHIGEVIGGEARDDHINDVYVNQVHVKAQVEGTNASFRENDKLASDVDVVVEGL